MKGKRLRKLLASLKVHQFFIPLLQKQASTPSNGCEPDRDCHGMTRTPDSMAASG